jgi:flagellar motor switch protein FliG
MAEAENEQVEIIGPGARRAAALLVGLGAEVSKAVFKQLKEPELRRLALGSKDLRQSPAMVDDALKAFVDAFDKGSTDGILGDELLRQMAHDALGPDAARRAFDGTQGIPGAEDLLGPVAKADAESLSMVLTREQPQTVALVLSSLSPERAAEVMDRLPPTLRPAVVARMATVEAVAPEVLREVQQALSHELKQLLAEGMRKVDGRAAALEILRRTPAAQQSEVLSAIEQQDSELAGVLRGKLFTFDDLIRLSDRDIQALMKDLDTKRLTIALRGGTTGVKDKFLKNMSSRAASMLEDDMQALGPVRLSEVEAAQAEIAKTAIDAAEKGRITIVRPTDKML